MWLLSYIIPDITFSTRFQGNFYERTFKMNKIVNKRALKKCQTTDTVEVEVSIIQV